jgi:hypothetical protein
MTWFAWRSQRLQLLVCVGVVALVAAVIAWTGAAYHSALMAEQRFCSVRVPIGTVGRGRGTGLSLRCLPAEARLQGIGRWVLPCRIVLMALPGVLGLVLGGPLVAREIEHGTNRLAWTQSIGRTRWLVVKLLLAGLLVAVVVVALDPLLGWWNTAVQIGPRIDPNSFSITGFVDVAYAVFAFMLGTALGSLIRRTGWAVAAGVPLFVGFRYWVMGIRSHFALLAVANIGNPFIGPGAGSQFLYSSSMNTSWLLSSGFVPDGRTSPGPGQNWDTGFNAVFHCLGPNSSFTYKASNRCAQQLKVHFIQQFQPASHFWELQTVEAAIFAGAAAVLGAVTLVAVRRWRT